MAAPAGWAATMTAPVWHTEAPADAALDSDIAAHVEIFASPDASRAPGANARIHFPEMPPARPLDTLGRALARRTHRDAPVTVIVVLPPGAFERSRSAIEAQLGSLGPEAPEAVVMTEDHESGWARTFAVERRPATYLLDGAGSFAWQEAGRLDAGAIADALDRHAIAGARPGPRLVRAAMRRGDRAPDALFEYARGERIALRKLRGRPVLLNFWKSWSAPCLKELDRLERLHQRAAGSLVVLAVNDGEDPARLADVARARKLTITVVPDPDRLIAARYRVQCWPTTISIDERGRVDDVQLGVMPDRDGARPRPSATAT
jgi:thiol-disulfide isomerase/thioredoxin